MDSLQAKRANAISFQLRLRGKKQPVKKRQTRQVPVGFVGFSSLAPNHLHAMARRPSLHVEGPELVPVSLEPGIRK